VRSPSGRCLVCGDVQWPAKQSFPHCARPHCRRPQVGRGSIMCACSAVIVRRIAAVNGCKYNMPPSSAAETAPAVRDVWGLLRMWRPRTATRVWRAQKQPGPEGRSRCDKSRLSPPLRSIRDTGGTFEALRNAPLAAETESPGSCWVARSRPGARRAARGANYQPAAEQTATASQRST
jgi:hypothetical protein